MPRAIKVTDENLDYIVTFAKELHFDLSYLGDNAADARENGEELYVITDGKAEWNNIVFTTFWSSDFFRIWKFKDDEDTSQFMETVKL